MPSGTGILVGGIPTRLDRSVIGYTRLPTRSMRYQMWRYPSIYPSTDLVSAPYPGTYPRSQITRVANPVWGVDLRAVARASYGRLSMGKKSD
eukprot:scaffold68924_cov80-Cyclotella_meneghiniana.AAC.3